MVKKNTCNALTINNNNEKTRVVQTYIEVVRTCLPIIRPGKDHLARHCGGSLNEGKTKEVVLRQRQRVDTTGLSRDTEGCGRQTETEAAGCLRDRRWCPYDPTGQGTDR